MMHAGRLGWGRSSARQWGLVALLSLVLVLVGCGADQAEEVAEEPEQAPDETDAPDEPEDIDTPDAAPEEPEPEEDEPIMPAEMTSINFRFDWLPAAKDLPVLAAEEFGWFTDRNLDVTHVAGTGSGDSVVLTGAGEFQLAIAGASSVLTGLEQDIPVRSVGVILQRTQMGWAVLPDSDIQHPRDFEGHTVGIQPASISYQYWLGLVAEHDLDLDEITEISVGFTPEPLLTGEVDVFPAQDFFTISEALDGEWPRVFLATDYGLDSLGPTLIVNGRFADENPEAVHAFVDAYCQGMRWAIENPDDALSLVLERYPDARSPAYFEHEVPESIELWQYGPAADGGLLYQGEHTWQAEYDLFRGVEFLERDLDHHDAWTDDFREHASHCRP